MSPDFDTVEEAKAALREAEAALERAMAREHCAVEAEREKLAELAHEIKTPLNALLGYAHMLDEGLNGAEGSGPVPEHGDYARTVYKAALHLQAICDNILGPDQSLVGGGERVDVEDVDVGKVIDEVLNLFSAMARDRGVALKAEVAEGFPILRTDPKRLNQILINLVSNAVKFTPSGGSVSVNAEFDEAKGAMIFVISDTGQGMSADQLSAALNPYTRDRTESPHGDEGMGIGLSIAARLARQLRGDLSISSELAAGTVVSITLPLRYDDEDVPTGKSDFEPDIFASTAAGTSP